MIGEDGTPRAPESVHGVYFTSGGQGPSVSAGPLRPGYGEPPDPNHAFGPDNGSAYTMGKIGKAFADAMAEMMR